MPLEARAGTATRSESSSAVSVGSSGARRPIRWVVAGAVVAVLAAGTFFFFTATDEVEGEPPARETATVEVRDLVAEESFSGTVSFAGATELVYRAAAAAETTTAATGTGRGPTIGGSTGTNTETEEGPTGPTVTWLPPPGAVIEPGEVVYKLDEAPVVLLTGDVPVTRSLSTSADDGPDIRRLEENLVALGYDPAGELTVDEHYSSATAAAVERWQEDLGLELTGQVALGTVVFAPGAIRIGEHLVDVGTRVSDGDPILELASTVRELSFGVEAERLHLLAVGTPVEIRLPDGAVIRGTITSISTDVDGDGDGDVGGDRLSHVVTATVDDEVSSSLSEISVDVSASVLVATSAVVVPAAAIVALDSGGYALEVVDHPGSTRFVPVDVGGTADRWVEVAGDGIVEGTIVIAP